MVLYADDDANDAFFMSRAFDKLNLSSQLHVVSNGQLAIDYLCASTTTDPSQRIPRPDLLLLDVKMPEMSGLEVLQWVRARPEFTYLCVVMLTSSIQQSDISFCATHGADAYFAKPSRADRLVDLIKLILEARQMHANGHGWLEMAENKLAPTPSAPVPQPPV